MIDWDSDDWGGRVHLASNGSWVNDRHDDGPRGGFAWDQISSTRLEVWSFPTLEK
jgi:hypothetical protein